MKIYQHNKRKTNYIILYEDARLQVANHPELDMTRVVIYQCLEDSSIWVRPASEFYDGRFSVIE